MKNKITIDLETDENSTLKILGDIQKICKIKSFTVEEVEKDKKVGF